MGWTRSLGSSGDRIAISLLLVMELSFDVAFISSIPTILVAKAIYVISLWIALLLKYLEFKFPHRFKYYRKEIQRETHAEVRDSFH